MFICVYIIIKFSMLYLWNFVRCELVKVLMLSCAVGGCYKPSINKQTIDLLALLLSQLTFLSWSLIFLLFLLSLRSYLSVSSRRRCSHSWSISLMMTVLACCRSWWKVLNSSSSSCRRRSSSFFWASNSSSRFLACGRERGQACVS